MRVTQQILFGNMMRDVNKNRSEMGKIQSDLSSGRTVRLPSHGPVEFQRSRIIEENLRKEVQYQDNISSGLRQSRMAQESLEETVDRLIDVKKLMVQGASSTTSEQVHQTIAQEIQGIRDTLINSLNVQSGDRYLFAGTNSSIRPFELVEYVEPVPPDPDENPPGLVENNSNDKNPSVLVGDGITIDISISGVELRDTDAGDLFEVLENVITALEEGDSEAVNGLLGDIDLVVEHITNMTGKVATNINRMDFMFEQYEATRISQKSQISDMIDTNYAQAFSDLQTNQIAYEASMAVHSTMFSNTLLDYL
ncbi:MAG: hypothetical protein WD513_01295 [Balneolaceae bacterium]